MEKEETVIDDIAISKFDIRHCGPPIKGQHNLLSK